MEQNASDVSDLKAQIALVDNRITKLHASTEKERKEHIKIRDSVLKRYASKLQGNKGQEKLSAKQDKEEREFLEAWQEEKSAQERREELGRALEQAEKERRSLQATVTTHKEALRDLDQLYQSIFGGPTPEVLARTTSNKLWSGTDSTISNASSKQGVTSRPQQPWSTPDNALAKL